MGKQKIWREFGDKYDWEDLDCSLVEFVERLWDLAAEIGADREGARVSIEKDYGYYDDPATISAKVYRYETEAEASERLAQEKAKREEHEKWAAAKQEAREREVLAALKAKYDA